MTLLTLVELKAEAGSRSIDLTAYSDAQLQGKIDWAIAYIQRESKRVFTDTTYTQNSTDHQGDCIFLHATPVKTEISSFGSGASLTLKNYDDNGGDGVVSTGLDVSGAYDVGAIDLPYVDGNAAVSIAALESAFGTDDAKQGVIGLYKDNNDAVWLILGDAATGKYQKVASTAVTS